MIRNVQDLSYPSGYPGTPPSGAFQDYPNLEGFDAQVIDSRASGSTAYGLGTLWIEQFLATNAGDAYYTISSTSGQALPLFSYGILTAVPSNPAGLPAQSQTPNQTTGGGFEIRIRQKGTCTATVTTGGTYAVAAGTLLIANGTGGLTPIGATTPAPGIVLAIAKGTQAINLTGQVLVTIGGY